MDLSGPAAEPATVEQAKPAEFGPGEQAGGYRILRRIGEGGSGMVYMAEQEEPIHRYVALKVIKLGMDTRSVIARFDAERQALALMDHASIAKVLDAGATESGRPYFVMELVEGIKITEFCDQNHLSLRERLGLFVQVCRAVQHAHQKGIIHRDLKPSNILVTVKDEAPVPKIIDFGIAKATQRRLTDLTVSTELHQFIGTPAYMSPEQAEMSGLDVDTRSDIYSLGVLLYELLTGKTPFDAEKLLARGLNGMRRTIFEEEPVRPSARLAALPSQEQTTTAQRRGSEPNRLITSIQGDLDAIVMKCLEKDRTRRYETANGLAMDLQRHLNNETVLARPQSKVYRLQKLVRRNKLAFAAGTVVFVALVGGFGFSTWSLRRERQAKAEAVKQQRFAQDRARDLRRQLYVSDMGTAWRALQDQQFARAHELLQPYRTNLYEKEELRGLEWRLIWQLSRPNYTDSFGPHTAKVSCVVFSPDETWLATASDDRTVAVWDPKTKRSLPKLEPLTGSIDRKALAVSPNGRLLAAKGGDQLRVWLTETWQEATPSLKVESNYNGNNSVVFSPDSLTLATRAPNADGTLGVTFWNTETWQKIEPPLRNTRELRNGHSTLGTVLAYSSDGQILAVSDWEELQIRNARKPENVMIRLVRKLADEDRVMGVAISAEYLAAAYRDGIVVLWQRSTWKQVAWVNIHQSSPAALAFSTDGSLLAAGGDGDIVGLWDVAGLLGRKEAVEAVLPINTFRGHTSAVTAVTFRVDGRTLVSASDDGTVKFWSIDAGTDRPNLAGSLWPLGFSADGTILAALHGDGRVHRWDVGKRRDLGPIGAPDQPVLAAATNTSRRGLILENGLQLTLSSSGRQLALACANGAVELWQVSPPTRSSTLPGDGNRIRLLQFSPEPDPQHLLVLSRIGDKRAYYLHNLAQRTPSLVASVNQMPKNSDSSFAFSLDGKRLAILDGERGLTLFDLTASGRNPRRIGSDSRKWESVAFSPDGSRLATGDSSLLWLWDVETGRVRQKLVLGYRGVPWLTFSADGKSLLTCDWDNNTRFWNLALGKEILTIANFFPIVGGVWLSRSGNAMALVTARASLTYGAIELFTMPSLEEMDALEREK